MGFAKVFYHQVFLPYGRKVVASIDNDNPGHKAKKMFSGLGRHYQGDQETAFLNKPLAISF